jgi:hypothetical protein
MMLTDGRGIASTTRRNLEMKKKYGWMGLGIAVSSVLLISSVYAGVGDYAGYEAYKSAIKETSHVQSVTANMNVTVKDNDQTIVSLKSIVKNDSSTDLSSAKVELTSKSMVQSAEMYQQEDQHVLKLSNSELYTILASDEAKSDRWKEHKQNDSGHPDESFIEAENLIDSLVGNLRSQVMLKDTDNSGKEIIMELKDSQIPTLVNTVGSLLIKHSGQNIAEQSTNGHPITEWMNTDFVNDMPKLVSEISIHSITLKANIDQNNFITSQEAGFVVYGVDSAGVEHELVVSVVADFSDYNHTSPDHIDLTGKQTQILNVEDFEH